MKKLTVILLTIVMLLNCCIFASATETEKQDLLTIEEASEKIGTVAAGSHSTMWLREDGTVASTGYKDLSEWTDIVMLADGIFDVTLGLKNDGRVICSNPRAYATKSWCDIVDIDVCQGNIAGLTSAGTVVVSGYNDFGQCNVSRWTDIVDVAVSEETTYGLKSNGTLVTAGKNWSGQRNVAGWTDIVAISAGGYHIVGLKSDGTVVATGLNADGQCDVEFWTDIVAIDAGYYHTVGLRADGTVVSVGYNGFGQGNVGAWTDVVAINAGYFHTAAQRADGTMVAVGANESYQCEVN